jgi:serine/threonine-protein kinase RsbW
VPIVEVTFTPLATHVRTGRLIAAAVARRAGVPEEYLDEIRLAVGEACSRAVGVQQRHAPDAPVTLRLADDRDRYTVEVGDTGPADPAAADLGAFPEAALAGDPTSGPDFGLADLLPPGFGLAVIAGLVDEMAVDSDGSGTRVRMSWPTAAGPDPAAPDGSAAG